MGREMSEDKVTKPFLQKQAKTRLFRSRYELRLHRLKVGAVEVLNVYYQLCYRPSYREIALSLLQFDKHKFYPTVSRAALLGFIIGYGAGFTISFLFEA
jgi:hypothetical protein